MRSHSPFRVKPTGGLWNRGDEVPQDHLINAENVKFNGEQIVSRNPLYIVHTRANIARVRYYQRRSEATARAIILDTSGNFYDSAVSLVTPFLTLANATDFAAVTFYDRFYISPHDGNEGLSGTSVYVWNGTTLRTAGGAGPATLPTFAAAGAGIVDPGIHLCAYAYEYESGFISRPASSNNQTYIAARTVTVGQDVRFNNIPVGGTGVVARWILMTKRIDPINYSGDVLGYEYFLAHRIADNSTTTYNYNKYDTHLQQSADHLFDQLTTILAGVCIGRYANRLIVGGFSTTESIGRQAPITDDLYTRPRDLRSLIYVSEPGEPETFSAVHGYITVDPTEFNNVSNVAEFRDMLLVTKPTQCYITRDNGDVPTSWKIEPLDKGIGALCNGISETVLSRGSSADVVLIASLQGLMMYNGVMSEFPLTWKVKGIWDTITEQYLNSVQVLQDAQSKTIYVSIPYSNTSTPIELLVGDYSKGLNHQDIRWSKWTFGTIYPRSIALTINSNNQFELQVAGNNNVYAVSLGNTDVIDYRDLGTTPFTSGISTAFLYKDIGSVHHLHSVLVSYSQGPLSIYGVVGIFSTLLRTVPAQSEFEPFTEALGNIKGNKIGVTIICAASDASDRLNIRDILIYLKPIWANRPL